MNIDSIMRKHGFALDKSNSNGNQHTYEHRSGRIIGFIPGNGDWGHWTPNPNSVEATYVKSGNGLAGLDKHLSGYRGADESADDLIRERLDEIETTTRNHRRGFYGTRLDTLRSTSGRSNQASAVLSAIDATKSDWNSAHGKLTSEYGMKPGEARDFLDSVHGRHLADSSFPDEPHKSVSAAVRRFRKTYQPSDFEG